MLRTRLIGVAVLLTAIAAAWLGIAKPDPFHHPQLVRALFDHVQGIALVQRWQVFPRRVRAYLRFIR